MNTFEECLNKTHEVGYIEEVVHSIVYVSGLPSSHINEIVLFEGGGMGQILSLTSEYAEVILLTTDHSDIKVGTRVARTDRGFTIKVSQAILGKIINTLELSNLPGEEREIYIPPLNILNRSVINEPLFTGVTVVDLVVPLGKGQRELIIGDRKTGKTDLLLQAMLTQSSLGTICVYAGVGKKSIEIKKVEEFIASQNIGKNSVVIASRASDTAGVIFITPYVAMAVAEYFRDKGKDVLLVLDDLTNHAKAYREITLLAKRFPGRNSYPGDIFYVHSRLMERAGKFKTGSITCLPVAETIMGDLSGFIQTNLMAMTDGHIFLDTDLANLGRHPAVNPFLSVTRVGYQAQSPLVRDLSRELNSFLVKIENLRQLMHFGAELSETVKANLDLGDRTFAFFDQLPGTIVSPNASVIILASLWAGYWNGVDYSKMKLEMKKIGDLYLRDKAFRQEVDKRVTSHTRLIDIIDSLKQDNQFLIEATRMGNK